jgi:hypothetical protein
VHGGRCDAKGAIVVVHGEKEGSGRGGGPGDGEKGGGGSERGGKGRGIAEPPVVRDQSEPIVDLDAAKGGLKCTGKPVHVGLHDVHPPAGVRRHRSNLFKPLHAIFKRGKALVGVG